MREGHQVGLTLLSPGAHFLGLRKAHPINYLHVVPQWGRRHHYDTLAATNPCPILLPKGGSLTSCPPLVCILDQIPPNGAGGAGHLLGLNQVHVQ